MSLENNDNYDNNTLRIDIDCEQMNSNLQLESLESNGVSNMSLKKKRLNHGRPKDSFIWKYFNEDENGEYRVCQVKVPVSINHPDGKCNKKYPNISTTTNTINHLVKSHKIVQPNEQQKVFIISDILLIFIFVELIIFIHLSYFCFIPKVTN